MKFGDNKWQLKNNKKQPMKKFSVLMVLISALSFGQKYSKAEISLINNGNIETALPIFQTSDAAQHHVLLSKSIDAKPKDRYTKILVNRMKSSLLSTDGGVGIAAPQVGINRNIIWVQRFDKAEKFKDVLQDIQLFRQKINTLRFCLIPDLLNLVSEYSLK